MFGRGDSEAHGEREIGVGAHAFDQRQGGVGDVDLLAGDAGAGNQIDEAAGVFGDQFQALFGAGGGGEEDGVEAGFAHDLYVVAGLFHADVGKQAAVDSGGFGVARQRSKP